MISRLLLALTIALVATTQASAQWTTWPPLGGKQGVPPYAFYTQPHAYLGQVSQPICQLTAGATVNSDGETCRSNPKAGVGYQAVTLTGSSTLALPTNLPVAGGLSIVYMITHSGTDGPTLGTGFQYPGGTQPPECNGTTIVTGCWSTTAGRVDWLPCVSINSLKLGCGSILTNVATPSATWVLKAHAIGTSAGDATTNSVDTTGADLLVVNVQCAGTTGSVVVSDSKGNTYSTAVSATNGSFYNFQKYVKPSSVGSGHTWTGTGTNCANMAIEAQAWSGSATSSPLDQTNTGTNTGTSVNTGSITPSQNNELIVTGLLYEGGTSPSIDSGFTISDHADTVAGVNYSGAAAYLVQGTAAAVNPLWSWTGSNNAATGIASYKGG